MTGRPQSTLAWLLPLLTLSFATGILLGRTSEGWIWAAAVLVAAVALSRFLQKHMRLVCILLVGASLGFLRGWQAYHPPLPAEGEYLVTGVVVQEVLQRENGQVRTLLGHVTLNGKSLDGEAYWTWYTAEDAALPAELIPGAAVSFTAEIYHPEARDNPGGFDFREYLLQRGMSIGIYGADGLAFSRAPFTFTGAAASLRHRLTLSLMDVMGPESGAYATAMLLGNRDFIPEEDQEAFRQLGIAHILAVSGFHVGVLAWILRKLLTPLRLGRASSACVMGVLLAGYCLLTGAAAPVVRASLFLMLRDIGRLRQKQILPLHLLSLSALIQLFFSPASLGSASFQLSYGAIAGLLLIHPFLEGRVRPKAGVLRRLWQQFSAALSAQLGLLMPQLTWFGRLPLISLVLNALVLSLFSAIIALYWVTLGLMGIPGLGRALGVLSDQATRLLLAATHILNDLDFYTLWTKQPNLITFFGWVLLIWALSLLLPRSLHHRRSLMALAGAVIIALSLIPLPHTSTEYIQFSVGDADCALIYDNDTVVVIDTARNGSTLAAYLRQRRLSVDVLILTHLHDDHAGGVRELLDEGIHIGVCFLPTGAENAGNVDPASLAIVEELRQRGVAVRTLARGDELPLPGGSLQVVWPGEGAVPTGLDANHGSLALYARLRGVTMLLTGDLTGIYEHYAALPADLLKAAHHGSASSTAADFVQAVNPQFILLSCGTDRRDAAFLARTGGIPVVSTEPAGAITVHFDDGRFFIETYLSQE